MSDAWTGRSNARYSAATFVMTTASKTPRRRAPWSLALAAVIVLGCRPDPRSGATLKIEAPAADMDADVYVDGNYMGQIQELRAAQTDDIRLAPGVHRVEIRKPGRFPVQKTVRVPAGAQPPVLVEAVLLEDPG